jgi:crotonobetainyl-CoA:carnitine CoA-transferase CaiB-like acyl-CoA transferase
MRALGLGHLRDDPRFAPLPNVDDPEIGVAYWEQVLERVREKTYAEWMTIFMADGNIGAERFTTTEQGMDHPQARHNGDVIEVIDRELGRTEQIGPLVRFRATKSEVRPPPGAGAEAGATATGSGPGPRTSDSGLSDLVVLELAGMYAAPFGPALLADLGLRVIKVEPLEGDPMRQRMPYIWPKTTQGKESIAVDLKTPEGRKILHQLVERANILMHNYRPGVPERLGMDYPTLKAINPNLVYHYAGSYGADGPYAHLPAYHPTPGAICGNAVQQAGEGYPPPPEADLTFTELKRASLRLSKANEGNPDPSSAMVVGTAMLLGLLARAPRRRPGARHDHALRERLRDERRLDPLPG